MKYLLVIFYLLFSISGLTFMKLGAVNETLPFWNVPVIGVKLNLLSILGYACYGISFIMYTIVITKFDLGLIVPLLSGIVNVLVFVIAILIFRENFSVLSVIGIILISLGIALMNLKK